MTNITEEIKEIVPVGQKNRWVRPVIIGGGTIVFLALVFFGGGSMYSNFYKDKIFPGVYIGEYHLGGLSKAQAKDFIENFNDRITKEGLDFTVAADTKTENVKLSAVAADDSSVETVSINSDATVEKLLGIGRSQQFLKNLWEPAYFRFTKKTTAAEVVIDDRFMADVESSVAAFGNPPRNANVKVTGLSPLTYSLEPEKGGFVFDYEQVKNDLRTKLGNLSIQPVAVTKKEFKPEVVVGDLDALVPKLSDILNYGDLGLNYTDPQTGIKRDWSIGPATYTSWLEVRRENGEPIFALNKEKVKTYLETLRPLINVPAKDAKFVMENDRVKEFEGSQLGLTLNEEKTYSDLDAIFKQRNYRPAEVAKTVTVSVDTAEPTIGMADVNNLGIMEVIGVGVSTFKDSHTNRIKNIANAVKRLNGILIKPGEEFSANKFAGPYTAANGFFPEMVIKGNRIIPEIGGGMCQIGTTLFRMAMNTGLPITQRRNHSLVVSYYADPVNGNPGTDATLYEPSLDLKFLNDTGNYMLLQTSIDYNKQQLVFTLWGKSDGRKGSYTHPTVSKWIPAGAPQVSVSASLKPGERKCQAAFRGAVASFTYTIILPNGEKKEQVFDSYYRPLPQICVVGPSSASAPETPTGPVTPVPEAPLEVSETP